MSHLDETGEDDNQDAILQYIVVPEDSDVTSYPINRPRRISVLHCIATDGTSPIPMIVLPRKTVDNEVFDELSPYNILFKHQSSGFCTGDLFLEWFVLCFMPFLMLKRADRGYEGPADLINDGFKGHCAALKLFNPFLD